MVTMKYSEVLFGSAKLHQLQSKLGKVLLLASWSALLPALLGPASKAAVVCRCSF